MSTVPVVLTRRPRLTPLQILSYAVLAFAAAGIVFAFVDGPRTFTQVLVIGLSTATLYLTFAPRPHAQSPSAVELSRAAAQAELVFGYTARALAASRNAATDRVLALKVSPAVRGGSSSHPPRSPR